MSIQKELSSKVNVMKFGLYPVHTGKPLRS